MRRDAKSKAEQFVKQLLKDCKAKHEKVYKDDGTIDWETTPQKIKLYGLPEIRNSGRGIEIHYKLMTGWDEDKKLNTKSPIVESKVEVFK